MIRPLLRLVALFVLALQLHPVALVAACEAVRVRPVTGCEESMPHPAAPAGPTLAASADAHVCLSLALCGAPTAAIVVDAWAAVAAPSPQLAAVFDLPTPHAGDGPPPLSPPPQA